MERQIKAVGGGLLDFADIAVEYFTNENCIAC